MEDTYRPGDARGALQLLLQKRKVEEALAFYSALRPELKRELSPKNYRDALRSVRQAKLEETPELLEDAIDAMCRGVAPHYPSELIRVAGKDPGIEKIDRFYNLEKLHLEIFMDKGPKRPNFWTRGERIESRPKEDDPLGVTRYLREKGGDEQ